LIMMDLTVDGTQGKKFERHPKSVTDVDLISSRDVIEATKIIIIIGLGMQILG